jgi:Ser/Thr protein kinase RdoA (MazF antagonist)
MNETTPKPEPSDSATGCRPDVALPDPLELTHAALYHTPAILHLAHSSLGLVTSSSPAPQREMLFEMGATIGRRITGIRRFPSGHCNFVYELSTDSGQMFVLKVARRDRVNFLAGALYWQPWLETLGVVIPKVVAFDLSMEKHEFPFVIYQRLPGTDLLNVYPQLKPQEKAQIAARVTEMNMRVARIPSIDGYGGVLSHGDNGVWQSWEEVVHCYLATWEDFLPASDPDHALLAGFAARLHRFDEYFRTIRPTAFLEDLTLANVIIENGIFSGIVDVEEVAMGDPVIAIGHTKALLIRYGYDLEYVKCLCSTSQLNKEQETMVDVYASVFACKMLAQKSFTPMNSSTPTRLDHQERKRVVSFLRPFAQGA